MENILDVIAEIKELTGLRLTELREKLREGWRLVKEEGVEE